MAEVYSQFVALALLFNSPLFQDYNAETQAKIRCRYGELADTIARSL